MISSYRGSLTWKTHLVNKSTKSVKIPDKGDNIFIHKDNQL